MGLGHDIDLADVAGLVDLTRGAVAPRPIIGRPRRARFVRVRKRLLPPSIKVKFIFLKTG